MPAANAVGLVRSSARAFEEGLPPAQRKRLGQFFTGLPLGSLLAQLALNPDVRTVIDPMAGHGDLLDAAATTAQARKVRLSRLDGIELDSETAAFCGRRMAALLKDDAADGGHTLKGSAFDPSIIAALDAADYDLVITNPPYVRYQSQSRNGVGVGARRQGSRL